MVDGNGNQAMFSYDNQNDLIQEYLANGVVDLGTLERGPRRQLSRSACVRVREAPGRGSAPWLA